MSKVEEYLGALSKVKDLEIVTDEKILKNISLKTSAARKRLLRLLFFTQRP